MKLFNFKKNAKVPKNDFTSRDLPKDRLQLFWDILKNNLWKIVAFNGLYMMFLLPLLVVGVFTLLVIVSLNTNNALFTRALPFIADPNHYMNVGSSFFNEGMSGLNVLWTFVLTLPITLTIAGPAKAALYYVMRNLSWGEYHVSYSDFWRAFRNNWKQGLFFNFLTAVLYVCLFYAYVFYDGQFDATGNSFYQYALWIIVAIFVIYNMMKTFFFPQLVTYTLKIGQIMKNSFIFTLLQLPRTIATASITLLLIVLGFLFTSFYAGAYGVILLLYIFIGFALIALINMLFSNFVFDKYVNDLVPGAEKRKGMSPEGKKKRA